MASYNKCLLIGNLTRDPELRVTPKGTAICQFGLAINRQFKDEGGQTRDDTTFVDCEAWAKTGENISKFFTKGKPIFVEGRLKMDSWEDKTSGQKRSKMKVVVEQFQFVGGKNDGATSAGSGYGAPGASSSASNTPPVQTHGGAADLDEVPFMRMDSPCV